MCVFVCVYVCLCVLGKTEGKKRQRSSVPASPRNQANLSNSNFIWLVRDELVGKRSRLTAPDETPMLTTILQT